MMPGMTNVASINPNKRFLPGNSRRAYAYPAKESIIRIAAVNSEAMSKLLKNQLTTGRDLSLKIEVKFSNVGLTGIQLALSHSSNGLKAVTPIQSSGRRKKSANRISVT